MEQLVSESSAHRAIGCRKFNACSNWFQKIRRMEQFVSENSTHGASGFRKFDTCSNRFQKIRRIKHSVLENSTCEVIDCRRFDIYIDRSQKIRRMERSVFENSQNNNIPINNQLTHSFLFYMNSSLFYNSYKFSNFFYVFKKKIKSQALLIFEICFHYICISFRCIDF